VEDFVAGPRIFFVFSKMFNNCRAVPPFVAHSSNVNCLALGRKSAGVLVTGGEDALINVWRVGRPAALLNLSGHISPITCVDFDHREEMVTGGSFGGSMKVFDLTAHGKVVRTYQGHHTAITSLDHHPYGGHVVSGSTDATVRLWDLRRKNCRSTFKGHAGGVTCVRFSPDGSQVVSGSEDGRIKIWDLNAGKLLQEFQHKGVRCLEYHPNDFLMCSTGKDKCIKMWDVDRMELVNSSTKQAFDASCVRFDRHGGTLLTVSDAAIKSWAWEPSFQHVGGLNGMSWGDNVQDIRVTSTRQNQAVVCASTDSFVSTWVIDLGTGKEKNGGGEGRSKGSKGSEGSRDRSERNQDGEYGEKRHHDDGNRGSRANAGEQKVQPARRRQSPQDIDRRRGRTERRSDKERDQKDRRTVQEVSPKALPKTLPKTLPSTRTASPQEQRRASPMQRTPPRSTKGRRGTATTPPSEGKRAPPRLTHSPVTSPVSSPVNSPRRSPRRSSPTSGLFNVPLSTTSTTTTSTSTR
jgi:hypothetical protein